MKNTQIELIRKALKEGRKLTQKDAFFDFGCFRLASRIADLRRSGMNIISKTRTENGKSFAEYHLAK